ncbi:NAD(P)H-binding protein [Gemella cuniculi]|uniref:NAD(P)H-binding protein n=1 Tax=Gemella cuniculi TaxID=150240 RepID=UPI000416A67D|nr:NAD(P)H-binding protein [Gemella cuniculi]
MVKKVIIIGATGSLGRVVREDILNKTDCHLILFSRTANTIDIKDPKREIIKIGDVYNNVTLDDALKDVDVVFAALSGNLGLMAEKLVHSVERSNVKKLIFISSMGIYNEIPAHVGERGNLKYNPMLQTYRDAADIIENSKTNYTIIRPGWFDNNDTNYEITHKGQEFGGHNVSRKSIADLVLHLIKNYELYKNESIGINRPE